jgi:HSP20 family molecular chaperone IbpA
MEVKEMTAESKAMEVEKQEIVPEEGTERTRECPCFMPRADIYQTEEKIVIVMDMPSIDADKLDITLDKNVLTINGYAESNLPEGYSLVWSEYEHGDYQRRFTLPDEIDRDNIEAIIRDGVLHLDLPKADAQVRKIAIKAE